MSSIQYLIGKTLGKYEVLAHIGHGGMAEVYKGQQSQLDRMVAIKVLHPFLADDAGFVVRFQREARIVATLRHPNIVQVYDFDHNEELDIYYMVMEYIEGPTLGDRLEEAVCTPEETARIGAAIAQAMDYAHQRSMVHRDIKPANIMFLDDEQPVLTDFGIARMLTLSGLTASGAMVGTPAYMAPEIGLGKPGTALSDIYSLSVVLYQAVTGALPFTAETPMGMVMQHINKSPLRPSAYVPDLPQALEAVIMRGLEKDPADRYATASDLAQALQLVYDATTDSQRPSDAAAPPDEPVASVALLESAALAPILDAAPEDDAPYPDEGDAAAPGARGARLLRGALMVALTLLIGGGLWFGIRSNWLTGARTPETRSTQTPERAARTATPMTASPPTALVPTPTEPPETADDLEVETAATATDATAACTQRVRVNSVQIKPAATVAPGAAILVTVSLRNSGSCAWPANAALNLVDTPGNTASPERFLAASLPPGETIQFLIPMTAPEALGTYESVWELQVEDHPLGRGGSGLVTYQITVDDVPESPIPVASEPITETSPPTAIEVLTPTLLSWERLSTDDLWRGAVAITLTGGTGAYRVYQDAISAETEVATDAIPVQSTRCQPAPLALWILSGAEVLNWTGMIPPPASMACP